MLKPVLPLLCLFALLPLLPLQGGTGDTAAGVPAAEAASDVMQRDARCGQFIAHCLIDGRPARMLVDTGATHTVVAQEFAARELPQLQMLEGVRLAGNAEQSPRPAVATVAAGGRTLPPSLVLLIPLEGVNSMMGQPIDGILGMGHLRQLPFTLEVRQGGLGQWQAPAGDEGLMPLKGEADAAGRVFLTARCGDSVCRLLLDSGSNTTTWPAAQWPAGAQANGNLHVADVNGARALAAGVRGKPADLELAGTLVLRRVSPLLLQGESGHVLGLDALDGYCLIHRPGQGFRLMPGPPKTALFQIR